MRYDVDEIDRPFAGSVNQPISVIDARLAVVFARLDRLDPHPGSGFLLQERDYDLVDAVLLGGLKTLVALLPALGEFCIEQGVLSRQGSGFLE